MNREAIVVFQDDNDYRTLFHLAEKDVPKLVDACNKFLEQYKQEDKPKKLKLRITQKKAKRLQEILCRGCTDTTACGMCIACLDRYIKKEV